MLLRIIRTFTEAVTLIATNHVSDELYDEVSRYFTEDEVVNLLMAIATINSWNRIAIATRSIPGSYEPQALTQQTARVCSWNYLTAMGRSVWVVSRWED